jgi:hypothetical protein
MNHTQFTRDLTFNRNLGCLSDVCPTVHDLPSYLSTFGRTLGALHTVLGKVYSQFLHNARSYLLNLQLVIRRTIIWCVYSNFLCTTLAEVVKLRSKLTPIHWLLTRAYGMSRPLILKALTYCYLGPYM